MSLKEFGWQQPIVVDEQDEIVVGHIRNEAALKLSPTATLHAWDDGDPPGNWRRCSRRTSTSA